MILLIGHMNTPKTNEWHYFFQFVKDSESDSWWDLNFDNIIKKKNICVKVWLSKNDHDKNLEREITKHLICFLSMEFKTP